MTVQEKEELVEKIYDRMRQRVAEEHWHCRCLDWAVVTAEVLRAEGFRPLLQAGSTSWPRILREHDDGKVMTHFSYIFEVNARTLALVRARRLPEMHVWVALPETREIVDMTTKYWAPQCSKLANLDWPGVKPPEYLWSTPSEFPDWVVYVPQIEAIKTMFSLLFGGNLGEESDQWQIRHEN